jgi:hypothetical protein
LSGRLFGGSIRSGRFAIGFALDLIVRARQDVQNIAIHLLGPPNKALSNKHELRWGEHGRFVLTLIGPRAGKWRDWKDDEGGDALDLIERELSLDRNAALAWLPDNWFGGSVAPVDHAARERRQRADAADQARVTRFKVKVAAEIWSAAEPFSNSPAHTYLEQVRLKGRALPDAVRRCGALRWNGDERSVPGSIGAMIALMTDPVTGESRGIHRTWLNADFDRIERKMLGNWGCVRLWRDDEVTMGLALGEGIESTIAGALVTGRMPAWAALDAGGIATFPVLSGIESISIFVDNDGSGTGQKSSDRCAARWHEAGRSADLFTPRATDTDFNNVLLGRAA